MVLTDAELLELNAEIDRLNETLAAHEKQRKDCFKKALSSLVNPVPSLNPFGKKENMDLIAELRSISEGKAEDAKHLKNLTEKLSNAIAEKEASSSK